MTLFIALLLLFSFQLFSLYKEYQAFFDSSKHFTKATVLNQYQKRRHWVLKMQDSNGNRFYTTSAEDLKDLRGRRVALLVFRSKHKPSFWDFLQGFYAPSYILRVLPADSLKEKLQRCIASQHTNPFFQELFSALFLATPMKKEFRDKIANFSISHLVAISGFHLGLIVAVITFVFSILLKSLWQRFYPYKNLYTYAFSFAIFVAISYTLFLGAIPSLIRSLCMLLFGFFLYSRHMKILSFETLLWVVLILIAIFPKFLFSVGFWLSVSGVFYIYLFLHHFRFSKIAIFVLIHFWMYIVMMPLSLFIFHHFSLMQLFAPFLSMCFVLFYPVELLLHVVGFGGMLDEILGFLHSTHTVMKIDFPLWLLLLHILNSFLAIWYRWAVVLVVAIPVIFLIYHIA
ncbi:MULTISPECIES: ComEC/Rec2 family competence protein [unclassified Nitratiruptor]|uniref:ComEC/Rec2 family competence protein n=1 Tax=unclassified Nitratiruptor TaxID=2624044 RepID=UPI0019159FAB|nr:MULTISPECIES: ComEC/Rec2 family competence protein [unclassified Nitratiruptor]